MISFRSPGAAAVSKDLVAEAMGAIDPAPSRAVASAVNSISSFLPGWGRKTPPGAHSDFTILRRVLGMALRYRRGMAMAAGTTVVAALIQLLDPTVSREGRRYAARPLAGGDEKPGKRHGPPGFRRHSPPQ
jgi:hypothetical protein